jgi:hypothetical protein
MANAWQVSPSLGGPGGGEFDDISEVESESGRDFDEFRLVELQFFTWQAVGAIRSTYESVIDGMLITTKKHGRIGEDKLEFSLGPNEYILSVCGCAGLSRYAAGGVCVDTGLVLDGGLSVALSQHLRAASGAARALIGPDNDSMRGRKNLIVGTSLGIRARPQSTCLECCGDYDCALHVPKPGSSAEMEMLVVRSARGRAGDSLDCLSFVLGPPIPDRWCPELHRDLPRRTRRAIVCLLLASRREDSIVAKLDRDSLHCIFSWLARPART